MPVILRTLLASKSHNRPNNKHPEIAVSEARRRGKVDPRKKEDWQEPRPIPVTRICRAFGGQVNRIDEAFCLNFLWWWRPLIRCLDSDFAKSGNYRVPVSRRGFFPAPVFETLQEHHDAGEMHSLLHLWRVSEIGERIEELSSDASGYGNWPAYLAPSSYYSSAATLKRVTLGPIEIDLGQSDRAILKSVAAEIQRLRSAAILADDRVRIAGASNRNRHFNLAAFSIVEAIDQHVLLGVEKERLPWANVRKAIKEASTRIKGRAKGELGGDKWL